MLPIDARRVVDRVTALEALAAKLEAKLESIAAELANVQAALLGIEIEYSEACLTLAQEARREAA